MRFLKAHKLFNGREYLGEDRVLVLDSQNVLKEIVSENTLDKNNIEYLDGIITPGFINTHCHLELSHLKDKIPQHTGLPAFAKYVVTLRHTQSKNEIAEHMQQANLDMWNTGVVAVGDISNTEDSFQEKLNSKLHYHTFIELLGLNPENAGAIFEKGTELLEKLHSKYLRGSLAPHAPYSTSRELIKQIADHNHKRQMPLSIHNQESEEEGRFFEGRKSGFEDLYKYLGLDISWFKAPGTSSLAYYSEALPDKASILVHNTCTSSIEMEFTKNKDIFWCFCPGANTYIENRFPDFSVFSKLKSRICLGTDSLASNTELNIVKEANLLLKATNLFSEEDVLRAMTSNGAEALGISEHYGHFLEGKNAGLNLMELKNSNINFIKKLA